MYSSTKHQPILIQIPKLVNKTDHEESEATETDNSNYDKATEHTEDKESPWTIKYLDSLVQRILFSNI